MQPTQQTQSSAPSRENSILGFPTGDLAGLSVDDLAGNKTAVTMVMHYYKQLVEENGSLKNDLNTLKTYVSGYQAKKLDANVGSGLQFVATVLVGFGVNIVTADSQQSSGWVVLCAGIVVGAFGLYFALRDNKQ